jgi:hypothetical protein
MSIYHANVCVHALLSWLSLTASFVYCFCPMLLISAFVQCFCPMLLSNAFIHCSYLLFLSIVFIYCFYLLFLFIASISPPHPTQPNPTSSWSPIMSSLAFWPYKHLISSFLLFILFYCLFFLFFVQCLSLLLMMVAYHYCLWWLLITNTFIFPPPTTILDLFVFRSFGYIPFPCLPIHHFLPPPFPLLFSSLLFSSNTL